MDSVKIATFNAENLFARFQFKKHINPEDAIRDGWTTNDATFTIFKPEEKEITAQAILGVDADVIALQEIEGLDTLRKFQVDYLGGRKAYPYHVVVDGNDPRRIDVAILSRYPISNIKTHFDLWSSELNWWVFSRDCLAADIHGPGDLTVTLFVNHFKSMLDEKDPENGRRNTRRKREIQTATVKQIVIARFGANAGDSAFIVLGDLNDYMETDAQGEPGVGELVKWDQVINVVDRLPQDERWTHYFKGTSKLPTAYKQLDFLLLSKSLAERNPQAPYIERRGLPKRAKQYDGPRFPNVGENSPKASDHCPVMMELQF